MKRAECPRSVHSRDGGRATQKASRTVRAIARDKGRALAGGNSFRRRLHQPALDVKEQIVKGFLGGLRIGVSRAHRRCALRKVRRVSLGAARPLADPGEGNAIHVEEFLVVGRADRAHSRNLPDWRDVNRKTRNRAFDLLGESKAAGRSGRGDDLRGAAFPAVSADFRRHFLLGAVQAHFALAVAGVAQPCVESGAMLDRLCAVHPLAGGPGIGTRSASFRKFKALLQVLKLIEGLINLVELGLGFGPLPARLDFGKALVNRIAMLFRGLCDLFDEGRDLIKADISHVKHSCARGETAFPLHA